MNRFLLLILLLSPLLLGAQPTQFLITTGTTTQVGMQHWAYVVWDRAQSTTPSGRTYAVYGKSGLPVDPGGYARLGVVTPMVSAEVFAPLLARAESVLGDDLRVLDKLLDGMVDHLDTLIEPIHASNRPSIPRNTPIAVKLSQVLVRASQHPAMLEGLHGLKARHPGMALCLGIGWMGEMSSQVMTYELREFDLALNADVAVVGRVTLDSSVPPALVAPGRPVWVPNQAAEGDLNIRLRWAIPDELRRLGPQVQGYNVYRTTWQHARDEMGWHVTAPTLAELRADVQTQLVSREVFDLNSHQPQTRIIPGLSPPPQVPNFISQPVPVFTNSFFTELNVADLNADADTFFFADDNRRYAMLQPGPPLVDQAEYGYLIVARDLLGREGPPSLAGLGVACRTLPPDVPGPVKVSPAFHFNAGQSTQKLVIRWQANVNAGSTSRTDRYEILRSRNIADFRGNNGRPWPSVILATPEIVHTADGIEMSYEDDTVEADFLPGQTLAYAVRAVRDPPGPCGPFYSDPSPPAFGTLRDFKGPPAPIGRIDQHCVAPFVGDPEDESLGPAPADGLHHFVIDCDRLDEHISAVSFLVVDNLTQTTWTPPGQVNQAFSSHEKTASFPFTHPTGDVSVVLVVFGADGSVSWPYVWNLESYATNYATSLFHGMLYARSIDPCSKRRGDRLGEFSYGRVIQPTNAVALDYMGQTYVSLEQTSSYDFTLGAPVSVALITPSGGVSPLTFGVATSTSVVQFIDPTASGLSPAQLMTRYRLYTFDKSERQPVVPAAGVPVAGVGGKRLKFSDGAGAPPGTQVCVSERGSDLVIGAAVVNAQGEIVLRDPLPDHETRLYQADLFLGPARAGTCKHIPVATAADGSPVIVPVKIHLQFPAGSVEYRIYRRVEEGPLALIAQASHEFSGEQIKDVIRSDDSMPAVNCVIRYYAQALDKHGNPSPLTLLDTIKLGVGPSTPLPTPMMMPLKVVAETAESVTLRLPWFCPVAGVDRFRVFIKSTQGPPPYNGGGIVIPTDMPFTDPATGAKITLYDAMAYLTPRVGSSPEWAGPSFEYEVQVKAGATYYAAVEAMAPEKFDSEGFDKTPHGETSLLLGIPVPPKPVSIPDNVVPWPARQLPATETSADITAQVHTLGAYPLPVTLQTGPLYFMDGAQRSAVGVRIASWFSDRSGTFFGNPNDILLGIAAHDGLPAIRALPAVLYRQQVRRDAGGQLLPASQQGAVVQCSPLLTEIAYHVNGPGESPEGRSIVKDPAIGYKLTDYLVGLDIISFHLMDKLPVIQGASYRYWLVHFNGKNEPDRTLYAGEVTIPGAP